MAGRRGKSTAGEAAPVATPPVAEPPPHRTLLHRLVDSLRAQNWTAIGLEFLVVVFGVFLGLQATNWNASLSDRRDEAQALREIAADIRQDRREMAGARNIALRRIAAMREVLILAGRQAPTDLNLRSGEGGATGGFRRTPVPDAPALTLDERGALW